MGFFGNAVSEVKKASKKAADKANEVYAITKKKSELSDVKNKIRKNYEEIGKIIYQAKKDIIDSTSEVDALVTSIDELFVQEKEINEQINELKNIITCQSCQTENAFEAVFCVKCGEKLVKPVKEGEVEETQEDKDAVCDRVNSLENKAEEVIEVASEDVKEETTEVK